MMKNLPVHVLFVVKKLLNEYTLVNNIKRKQNQVKNLAGNIIVERIVNLDERGTA